MATVEIFTAARMQAIEDQAIVGARLDPGSGTDKNLVLIRNNNTEIPLGNVRGPIGPSVTVPDEINWNAIGMFPGGTSPVGGAGAPPLRLLAGKSSITTDQYGQETIYFPGTDPDFNGIAAVICQVVQGSDCFFTYVYSGAPSTPVGPNTGGCSVENIQIMVDNVTTTSFRVNVGAPNGLTTVLGRLVPGAAIRLGGTSNLEVSWIAFGW